MLINTVKIQIAALIMTLVCSDLPALTPVQDGLGKGQFDKQVKKLSVQIERNQKEYKTIEKDLLNDFPKKSRKSPFYLLIRKDFLTLRKIMKELETIKTNMANNHRKYKDQFSLGLFKSVEILKSGDEKWAEAKSLSEKLNSSITVVPGKLNQTEPLRKKLTEFSKKLENVWSFQKELESSIKESDRDYEKISSDIRKLNNEFTSKFKKLKKYKAYKNGENTRKNLNESNKAFSVVKDSLHNQNKSLNYLLAGTSKTGDEMKVWDLFQEIVDTHTRIMNRIENIVQVTIALQEKFEITIEFLDEFLDVLTDFDKDISFISQGETDARNRIISDSTKFVGSFIPVTVNGESRESPLVKLTPSFDRAKRSFFGLGSFLGDMRSVRQQFVDIAGNMEGLKTDKTLYQKFNDIQDQFDSVRNQAKDKLDAFHKEMDDFWDFYEKYDSKLKSMASDLSSLNNRKVESLAVLESDRSRFTALYDGAPARANPGEPPYTDLKSAFEISEKTLNQAEDIVTETVSVQDRYIDHVGTMDGLKTDDTKYDMYRNLEKVFDDTRDRALDKFEDYLEKSESFKEVILEHFINTFQFWELQYTVNREKSFLGNETVEENFGYIYDPNEYPAEPYHGKLISQYQLKLRMERSRGRDEWKTTLIFEGEHDFPIQGMRLQDGDSILFEIAGEDVLIKEESDKDGVFKFKWELPVDRKVIIQALSSENLIFKIHFITTTHRIGIKRHRKKILRDFWIPAERLTEWEKLVG